MGLIVDPRVGVGSALHLGEFPWDANRPDPARYRGMTADFVASDGYRFSCRSNGKMWVPENNVFRRYGRLAGAANNLPSALINAVIPGGLTGANGEVRLWLRTSHLATSGQKTITATLGGAIVINYGHGNASQTGSDCIGRVVNKGAQNSQTMSYNTYSGWGLSPNVVSTSVDLSQDQPLIVTLAMSVATDQLAIESAVIEIIPA